MSKILVFDADYIKYKAASACEKRTIKVIHTPSGREKEFKNRTEFYGRDKKSGWLGELNRKRTSPFLLEEFEIIDVQTPEPVSNCLHTVKMMIDDVCKRLGTNKYYGYIGKGDSFRRDRSTILEYKGNRTDSLSPVLLPEVEEYLLRNHGMKTVVGLEADDWVVIDGYKSKDKIVVSTDKDANGCEITLFNPDKFTTPEKIRGLGKLWINEKGEVDGRGRLFLYYQIASGDPVDNYKANAASDIRWGPKSAYKALAGCTTDREAWLKLKEVFQYLYPEPKVITGWRGDKIEIDYLYVLQEMLTMARMWRTPEDDVKVLDVFNKLSIEV